MIQTIFFINPIVLLYIERYKKEICLTILGAISFIIIIVLILIFILNKSMKR